MKLGTHELEQYLDVARESYEVCFECLPSIIASKKLNARFQFHYLKFDPSGNPKLDSLVQILANHLTHYAVSARKRTAAVSDQEKNQLYREARKLLRQTALSGEPGEMLLYFLLESELKAPQVISKISLKTNKKEEIKGSDGIHVGWDAEKEHLILYVGEAKIYQQPSAALTDAANSINNFYSEGALEHELFLVSAHFKWLESDVKAAVEKILDKSKSGDFKVVHACLIGFDWSAYAKLNTEGKGDFIKNFVKVYGEKAKKLSELVDKKSSEFNNSVSLQFEFFFVPFVSVQEFRDRLLAEI